MCKWLFLISLMCCGPLTSFAAIDAHANSMVVFEKTPLEARLFWENGPEVHEEAILRIEFKNKNNLNPTEPPGGVTVTVWKPDEKRIPRPATVQHITDKRGRLVEGQYRVSKLTFTEPGPWKLGITLKYPNQQTETVIADIDAQK